MAVHRFTVTNKHVLSSTLLVVLLQSIVGGREAVRLDRRESVIKLPTECDEPVDVDREVGTRWAVLVAGSSGYGNYRHQVGFGFPS